MRGVAIAGVLPLYVFALAEEEALDLARLRLREVGDEFDLTRILVVAEARLHHGHDLVGERRAGGHAGTYHDERLHDVAAQRVRLADHRGLRHRRMLEDRALDLEWADAIPRALDHVVGAALEPEVSVGVAAAEIADRHPVAAHEL